MQLIPRVFHRIWLGRNPLPQQFVEFGDTWARWHPGWEMRLWSDADLPPLINWACFEDARTPAQKSDIARYEILYRYGGVYVDTDFECLRSIEPLLGDVRAFSASEHPRHIRTVSIGIMGAVPGHGVFGDAIRTIPRRYRNDRPPNETTGPLLMSEVARRDRDLAVFPRNLFYPLAYDRRKYVFPRDSAYAVHHWAASWKAK